MSSQPKIKALPWPPQLEFLVNRMEQLRLQIDDAAIGKVRNHFLEEFNNSTIDARASNVDYEDANVRKFYVLRYMSSYVQVFYTLLEKAFAEETQYQSWYQQHLTSGFNIVSIGGGPGTEFFALFAHLQRHRNEMPFRLVATNLDKFVEWNEEFQYLNDTNIGCDFLHFDLTADKFDPDAKTRISQADIVTMSKIVSPLRAFDEDPYGDVIIQRLMNVLTLMKPKALLLFMDTNFREKFSRPIERAARQCDFTEIFGYYGTCYVLPLDIQDIEVLHKPSIHMILFIKN